MGKPSFERWSRRVVMAVVGALALAGCEATPRLAPAPLPVPEQPPQPIGCGLDCGLGHCVVWEGAPACACPPGHSGARCEGCEPGYQDVDGDGVCLPDCSMMALECGHGVCSSQSGVPRCQCDEGFDGPRCQACAPGFQDHDADGTCTADCASVTLECHGHGGCDDRSGTVACACEPGFAASDCSSCAAGFQDRDGDGVCAPDCARAAPGCGWRGVCDDSTGEARCACSPGSAGTNCERCADGFQDDDGDGVCRPDCATAALPCGVGSCSTASGVASCACPGGYVGAPCDRCAPGLQDFDFDGVCVPSCAGGTLSCNGYTRCEDGSGQAQCVCQPGYGLRGENCELLPVVTDPTFSAAGWSALGGARPGVIPAEAVCHGAARLVANVSLPQVSSPDAFAVTSVVVTPGDSFFPSESRALARVGESLAWLGASELGATTLACLGEGAQGGRRSCSSPARPCRASRAIRSPTRSCASSRSTSARRPRAPGRGRCATASSTTPRGRWGAKQTWC